MDLDKRITLLDINHTKWYPMSINSLEIHLTCLIKENKFLPHSKVYPLRKNIAYSFQYIEFLNKIRTEIYMTDVLFTQNIKSILVHGTTVIEAIFYYLIEANGFANETNWIEIKRSKTPEYEFKGVNIKNEVIVFEKTTNPIKTLMSFDQMSKKVESKILLGKNYKYYRRISALRKLRNKIHIHDTEHNFDTDWNNFNYKELVLIFNILHSIITSDLFKGSRFLNRFDYLIID